VVAATSWFTLKLSLVVISGIALAFSISVGTQSLNWIWVFAALHLLLLLVMMIWQKTFSLPALLAWCYWLFPLISIRGVRYFLLDQNLSKAVSDAIHFIPNIALLLIPYFEVGMMVFVYERFLKPNFKAKAAVWLVLLAIVGQIMWGVALAYSQIGAYVGNTSGVPELLLDQDKIRLSSALVRGGEIISKLIGAAGYLLLTSELLQLRDSIDSPVSDEGLTVPAESS